MQHFTFCTLHGGDNQGKATWAIGQPMALISPWILAPTSVQATKDFTSFLARSGIPGPLKKMIFTSFPLLVEFLKNI